MCMFVSKRTIYMYIYVYIQIHIPYIYLHTYVNTNSQYRQYICVSVCMHLCVYIYTCVYICVYVKICIIHTNILKIYEIWYNNDIKILIYKVSVVLKIKCVWFSLTSVPQEYRAWTPSVLAGADLGGVGGGPKAQEAGQRAAARDAGASPRQAAPPPWRGPKPALQRRRRRPTRPTATACPKVRGRRPDCTEIRILDAPT